LSFPSYLGRLTWDALSGTPFEPWTVAGMQRFPAFP
jgi:hypothetical protein